MVEELSKAALRRAADGLEQRTQVVELLAAAWQDLERHNDLHTGELVDGLVEAAAAFRSYRRLVSLLLSGWSFPELVADLDELNGKLNEARAWARAFAHRDFEGLDTDRPPAWLTSPLTLEEGVALAGVPASVVDQDWAVENAVLAAFADPTPENQYAAEVAVGRLQRRLEGALVDVDEARSWARWGYLHMDEGTKILVGETPRWLLEQGDR